MSSSTSELGAKAQIDFHCFDPECDGVVKFNLADIAAVHAKGKEITLEGALNGLTCPLHPGAEKFFKEKGILK